MVGELKRPVSPRVRVLHRLQEAGAVRSEWEGENGEEKNQLKDLRSEGEGTDETVCRQEEESCREGIMAQFEALLEPELRAIPVHIGGARELEGNCAATGDERSGGGEGAEETVPTALLRPDQKT